MKTHNTRIKEQHIMNYLDKNLKDCPEKKFIKDRLRDSFEDYSYDTDFGEWVTLPENSYMICDKCKKEVQEYWHRHTAYPHIKGESMLYIPPSRTETCLCKDCYNENMSRYL